MAGNIGYYSRPTRRVYVLRGFDGCEPKTFTKSASITAANDANGANPIVSGDIVSLVNGEWVRGATVNTIPHIALSDSFDTDVIAAGKLPALSCAGKFEIETVRYDSLLTYVEDQDTLYAKLNAETDAGVISNVSDATTDASIIGIVSRGVTDLNATATITGYTPNAGAKTLVHPQQDNALGPVSVLAFVTNYQRV